MGAADTARLLVERVNKLLGKQLGIKTRSSGTTWNGYQNFFAVHMMEELQCISAEEEYAAASSAQKRGIVSRARDAFKASLDKETKWIDVLKIWEEFNVVSTGCREQTYGSHESAFASTNREIEVIIHFSSYSYIHSLIIYLQLRCKSLQFNHIHFSHAAPLSKMACALVSLQLCH